MNESTSQEKAANPSHLQFQMWDKHLTLLNKIWDLETPIVPPAGQTQEEKSETHFHTTLWNQHLMTLNQSWHVPATLSLDTPSSMLGKMFFPLKKLLLRWIQPSVDRLVQQQNAYNAQVVQTYNGLVETINEDIIRKLETQREFNAKLVQSFNGFVDLIDSELARFDSELARLWKELHDNFGKVETRHREFQTMIWVLDRRKEALEIDEILLNQKLEQVLSLLRTHKTEPLAKSDVNLPSQERQDDYTYLVFENLYRGDETTIKNRQKEYLEYFRDCETVLDLGCGRGEFLELLRENTITGYGVDVNHVMIEYCRQKNLHVEEAEVSAHLQSLPDNSLEGIFSAQMIEHYSPKQLHQLLQLCFDKLQHQKYLVVETQNPQSLYALSHFYRDLSHEKPIHPDALQHLLKTVGFQDIHVEYKTAFPPDQLLQELDIASVPDEALRARLTTLNQNIRQLNDIIYGCLDYAIIARKVKLL